MHTCIEALTTHIRSNEITYTTYIEKLFRVWYSYSHLRKKAEKGCFFSSKIREKGVFFKLVYEHSRELGQQGQIRRLEHETDDICVASSELNISLKEPHYRWIPSQRVRDVEI